MGETIIYMVKPTKTKADVDSKARTILKALGLSEEEIGGIMIERWGKASKADVEEGFRKLFENF